ncbi:MAG: hypothetical protein ABEI52_03360, partial [Halobacteriaceae archaeon]
AMWSPRLRTPSKRNTSAGVAACAVSPAEEDSEDDAKGGGTGGEEKASKRQSGIFFSLGDGREKLPTLPKQKTTWRGASIALTHSCPRGKTLL